MKSLESAVAVARVDGWVIEFENARFFQWFPPDLGADAALEPGADDGDGHRAVDTGESVPARIAGFRADRAAARVADGRPYELDVATRVAAREVPIRVKVRALEGDPGLALVECWDVSREKEVQYMLDSYSSLAERNARDLQKEKERVERLLLNIMPRSILEEMKDYGTTSPQRFDSATILMLDFVGVTDMTTSQDPIAIISELDDIFSAFDRIVENFGCERLKTIGDAYLAVSGVPEAAPDHAQNIAKVALRIRRYLERRNSAHPQEWLARIGINTGPVIGSLVGIQKYVYDLFGPGINLAARMEQASEPMRITVSERTYHLLEDDFVLSPRGEVEIKGFGVQPLYFLEDEIRARL